MQASPETLGRLALALALTPAERAYLFELAGRFDPDLPEAAPGAPPSLIASVQAIRYPAYGLDRLWTACVWNDAAARLFVGWLDADHQRNVLRFVFLDASARVLIPEWRERARRLLAEFRADFGHTFRDAEVKAFIDRLKAESPLFARTWEEQDVQRHRGGLRTFDHPQDGRLAFEQHTFSLTERPDYKLVVLTPAGSATQGDASR